MKDCPFCDPDPEAILWRDENVYIVRDLYPVSPSHSLVVPFRHFASLFDATPEELRSIAMALAARRDQLALTLTVSGFNIGVNDGKAAGQTIAHAHVHMIPRFDRDVPDPRGGVRGVIPEKQKYPVSPASRDADQ